MFVVFQQPDGVELDHGITGHQLIFYMCGISAAPWFGVHGITGYQLIFYVCCISAVPWFGARPWYYWASINIFVVFQQSHGLELDHGITGHHGDGNGLPAYIQPVEVVCCGRHTQYPTTRTKTGYYTGPWWGLTG